MVRFCDECGNVEFNREVDGIYCAKCGVETLNKVYVKSWDYQRR